jgi:N-sulfoglucosamine sulfohydrolase
MRRRRLLETAALAGAGLALGRCGRPKRRPNILFCISDDQSYPHAGAYGAPFVRTPGFDRIAQEGVLFRNAFVSTPSCCPSRGSVLTGQDFYRLREASMNHTVWPGQLEVYPDILERAGYHVGFTGKGWGPGNWKVSGRKVSPAGPAYNGIRLDPPARHLSEIDYAGNFEAFLAQRPAGAPFCFWVGFSEPHRQFEPGAGARHGVRLDQVQVPGFLPDDEVVRSDLADYAFEIQYYDGHLERILKTLEKAGELDHTLVVATSDNGMAFPRAKATLYEAGIHVPLAMRWGERIRPGRVIEDLVSFIDLAPTFLEAAGLAPPPGATGRSLLPLLEASGSGFLDRSRDAVVVGLERHFPGSRPNGAGYPMRAVRTREFLYIRNLAPELAPAGDRPGPVWPPDDPTGGFGDIDGSPTKTFLWENRERYPELARLAFERRPREELYRIAEDPANLKNLAADPGHERVKQALGRRLDDYLARTGDPRALGQGELFERIWRRYPSLGSSA